jgi:DNA modification methylase
MRTPDWASDDGTVQLWCGDCLEIVPEIGVLGSVITDPPYGIKLSNHGRNGIRKERGDKIRSDKDWTIRGDDSLELIDWLVEFTEERDIPLASFASPYKPLQGDWRNILVWDKGPAVGAGGDAKTCWKRTFELIYLNRKFGKLGGKRDQAVLQHHVSPNFRGDFDFHPAQKPLPLLEYLITKTTKDNDVVLDPFMGSGTTGVACVRTNRRFLGIELDSTYFHIAVKRISEAIEERDNKEMAELKEKVKAYRKVA